MTATLSIPIDGLETELAKLFSIYGIQNLRIVHGGFLSQNCAFESAGIRYFLKQYRRRLSGTVFHVKRAEQFFAKKGLPIILPIEDVHGRHAFQFDGDWYSLFPYIEGVSPTSESLDESLVQSLGEISARFHRAGAQALKSGYKRLRLWNKEEFLWEYIQMEEDLGSTGKDQIHNAIAETLSLKKAFVQSNTITSDTFTLPFDHLVHGDLTYLNVFVDVQGGIEHVYDLEKVCFAPRAYDLAKSLMMNCFDDGWGERNKNLARAFLRAYLAIYPISLEELTQGVRMFMIDAGHMIWFDRRHVLSHDPALIRLYEYRRERAKHLGDDFVLLCKEIYPDLPS